MTERKKFLKNIWQKDDSWKNFDRMNEVIQAILTANCSSFLGPFSKLFFLASSLPLHQRPTSQAEVLCLECGTCMSSCPPQTCCFIPLRYPEDSSLPQLVPLAMSGLLWVKEPFLFFKYSLGSWSLPVSSSISSFLLSNPVVWGLFLVFLGVQIPLIVFNSCSLKIAPFTNVLIYKYISVHIYIYIFGSIWGLVSWPGIEPGPPELGVQSLSHGTTRVVPVVLFLMHLWGEAHSTFY